MFVETLLPLTAFAFVTSITPGPNNLMLMTSGANFGFRRTVPHMLGVGLGFSVMVFLVGIGLASAFATYPILDTILSMASVVYMLWLAWKIANAAAPGTGGGGGRPLSFLQAAAFQWVNPKAWAMALSAITLFAPGDTTWGVLLVALVFGAVNLPSVSVWCRLGVELSRFLTAPARLTAFNLTMAGLLILSLLPVIV